MKKRILALILITLFTLTGVFADTANENNTNDVDAVNETEVTTENPSEDPTENLEDGSVIDTESEDPGYSEGYLDDEGDMEEEAGSELVVFEKGVVLSVKTEEQNYDGHITQLQSVKIRLTTGKHKDEIRFIENSLSDNMTFDIPLEEGIRVVLQLEEYDDGTYDLFVMDYVRDNYIMYLLIFFIIAILFVGRWKGVKTIFTLAVTVLFVFKVHLPLILKGMNPIWVTVLVATLITIITMFFISGFKKKTLAAILGTMLGVIIAGTLAFYVGAKVRLTGLSSEEAAMLMYIPQGITFNFRNLLFSGILLGALGAVMDVSMSIASAIDEMHVLNPTISWKRLFLSGMSVGRDIMGTMSNTLILAYTGSTIPLLLLFMAYDTPFIKMVNLDIIATEIIRSLAGSIGLVLTIPITATIAVLLLKDTNKPA